MDFSATELDLARRRYYRKDTQPMTDEPEEIEVTAEMLAAGIEAACLFDPTEDDFSLMLPYIYRAMHDLSACRRAPSGKPRRNPLPPRDEERSKGAP